MAHLPDQPDLHLIGGVGRQDDAQLAHLLARADVLVDFTTAEASPDLLLRAVEAGVRPVSGTTGLSEDVFAELDRAVRARGIGAVWAANFAIGAALMVHFARIASRYMDAAEVIELHHDRKADAPSGTALATARAMREARGSDFPDPPVRTETLEGTRGGAEGGVRLHSVRLPGLVGHQEVLFGALGQVLTIRHDAPARESYVPGIALAARYVMRPDCIGLTRGLDAIMGLGGTSGE